VVIVACLATDDERVAVGRSDARGVFSLLREASGRGNAIRIGGRTLIAPGELGSNGRDHAAIDPKLRAPLHDT
jgi:hypothetical protein